MSSTPSLTPEQTQHAALLRWWDRIGIGVRCAYNPGCPCAVRLYLEAGRRVCAAVPSVRHSSTPESGVRPAKTATPSAATGDIEPAKPLVVPGQRSTTSRVPARLPSLRISTVSGAEVTAADTIVASVGKAMLSVSE